MWILAMLGAVLRLLLPEIDIMVAPGPAVFWLDRLHGWWTAIALLLSCLTLGRAFMRLPWLRTLPSTGLVGGLLALTVGWWAVELILTAVAWLTGLTALPPWLWVSLLAVGGTLTWPRVARWMAEANDRAGRFWASASRRQRGLVVVAVILAGAWVLPLVIQSLLPEWEWDAANTFLPQARMLADDGIWAFSTDLAHLLKPSGGSILYALCMAARAESAVLPLNLLASFGCAAVVFAVAGQYAGRRAGWWAAAVALTPNLLWELGTDARVDNLAALSIGVATLGLGLWWQRRDRLAALIVTCMALGVGFAVKTTTFYPAIGFAVALVLAALLALRRDWHSALPVVVLAVAVLAVPAGAWYLRNVMIGAHPLGSYAGRLGLTDRADEIPYPPEVIAAADARDSIIAIPRPQEQMFVRPRHYDPLHLFLPTDRHSVKAYQWLSPLLLAFVLLPIWRRDAFGWWLLLVPLVSTVLIGLNYWVVRYMTVALPLICVGAGLAFARARRRALLAVIAALFIIQIGWNTWAEWQKLTRLHLGSGVLGGRIPAMVWLSRVGYSGGGPALPMAILQLNLELADRQNTSDGVLLVAENRSYHITGDVHINALSEILIDSKADVAATVQQLRERGIRYILLNRWRYRQSLFRATDIPRERRWVELHLIDRLLLTQTKIVTVMPPFLVDPQTRALLTDPNIIVARLLDPHKADKDATAAPLDATPPSSDSTAGD
jgi:hypothetical protein